MADTPHMEAYTDTHVRSLNMLSARDRNTVERAIRERWPGFDDATKAQCVAALKVALSIALKDRDVRDINNTVGKFLEMSGQQQADEHLEEKYNRPDPEQPVHNTLVINIIPAVPPTPVRELVEERAP